MIIIGIESSCDETAAAVLRGPEVLSNVIHTQIALHAEYGGVVPEIASRDHLKQIQPVISKALAEAHITIDDVDAIAVTNRPGLSGALLIGVQTAKTLAYLSEKPLIAVDHLVGHLLACFVNFTGDLSGEKNLWAPHVEQCFPYIGLLASGGHTALYRVDGPLPEQIAELGGTRDDAAGEAYDKVAKLLGLGYPGGPTIDRLAAEGNPEAIELSRPMAARSSLEFSFSGLKTNVSAWVRKHGAPKNDQTLRDLCAAFQGRVVDSLVTKALRAAHQEKVRTVVLAGGVAANRELRERGAQEAQRQQVRWVVPEKRACTDNAAMIAYAGYHLAKAEQFAPLSVEISPRTCLPRVTHKGPGLRKHNR